MATRAPSGPTDLAAHPRSPAAAHALLKSARSSGLIPEPFTRFRARFAPSVLAERIKDSFRPGGTYCGDGCTHHAGKSASDFFAASDDDAANLVLWRGAHVFAVMNLYPYNNGHVLVVPYRPVTAYTALTADERHALSDAIDRVMRWQTKAFAPDGFNVGINVGQAGGAGVPDHLHAHVVPRWAADTNFMSTTADLKVIPEALQQSYEKLRACVTDDGV